MAIGKATELSECRVLIELLKSALADFGSFYFANEFSFRRVSKKTYSGKQRDQPDCVIFDLNYAEVSEGMSGTPYVQWTDDRAVVAVVDCKAHGVRIADANWKGQLYDYQMWIGSPLGFLTNFRDVLCVPMTTASQRLLGGNSCSDMNEVVAWIAGQIREYYTGIPQALPIERVSGTLRKSMEDLLVFTRQVDADKWEDILHISNLEDEELYEDEAEQKSARFRGAAFVALAQVLFYIIYRHSRIQAGSNHNPELAPLQAALGIPTNIQMLLRKLRNEINFAAIYHYEVLPLLPDSAGPVLNKIVNVLEGQSYELVINHDLIGQLFQGLIPEHMRKRLAAYYTKPKAAELLCKLTVTDGSQTVMDPACGSGTLLVNAYRQKKNLQGPRAQHERILGEVFGSDMSPFATILASVNLAVQSPEAWTNQVNVFNSDAFDLPSTGSDFFEGSHLVRTFIRQTPEGSEAVKIERGVKADVVLANPPFTRGSRLPMKTRKKLEKVTAAYFIRHGWRDWNLYSFFMLLAPNLLTDSDVSRIGMVLPKKAISTKHMEQVWAALFTTTPLRIKYVINASDEDVSFSESSEQEILVVMEKNYSGLAKFIQLKGRLDGMNIDRVADHIDRIKDWRFSSADFQGFALDQSRILGNPCRRWPAHSSSLQALMQQSFVSIDELPFVNLWAEVAPKPADYFWIPNKYWEIRKENSGSLVLTRTPLLEELIGIGRQKQKRTHRNDTLDDIVPLSWDSVPETIEIAKDVLVKSFVRDAQDLYDETPYLRSDSPHTYFVDQRAIEKDPQQAYYQWGLLLKEVTANWVTSPPKKGLIFVPSKIRLNTAKTLAYRTAENMNSSRLVSCIFEPKDMKRDTLDKIDVLFGYLTCSFFLLDFIRLSRQEAEAFRKMHATDMRAKFRFPNISELPRTQMDAILAASRSHNSSVSIASRPHFLQMVRDAASGKPESTLRALDDAWFSALGILEDAKVDLYDAILKELQKYPFRADSDEFPGETRSH